MVNHDLIKQRWYSTLLKAYEEANPTDSLTCMIGELSVEEAYDVQAMLVENKIRNGEHIIGWKVGCTSQAVMDQMKIDEPILGCMTSGSHYSSLREVKASDFCKLAVEGEIAFVIVSRPYNGNDPGLNLDLVKKIRELGITPLPVDFLDLNLSSISRDYPNIYWYQGQKILSSARKIEQTDNLYPIYLTNFACGPDSFISKYFDEEIERPYLELQIDEHSAEAGVITRLEAFLDSIRNRRICSQFN